MITIDKRHGIWLVSTPENGVMSFRSESAARICAWGLEKALQLESNAIVDEAFAAAARAQAESIGKRLVLA